MTRNLKRMGIAFVAVFALSAVVASAAQAKFDTFRTHEGKNVILTAEALGNQTTKIGSATTTCKKFKLGGPDKTNTNVDKTTAITTNPLYEECEFPPLGKATVTTTNCHYLFTAETTAEGMAETHIVCDAGKKIEIILAGCTISIAEQTIPNAVSYTNNGTTPNDDIKLKFTTGVSVAFTATGANCGLAKIPASGKFTYEGEITVTADEDITPAETTGAKVGLHFETLATSTMP